MAYVITNDCIDCGDCRDECPTESISQGPNHFEINPDTCIDCGGCADVCPAGAIQAN